MRVDGSGRVVGAAEAGPAETGGTSGANQPPLSTPDRKERVGREAVELIGFVLEAAEGVVEVGATEQSVAHGTVPS